MTRRILISGAGIAGPTLVSWLAGSGWEPTVVERFSGLRDEGQNIDVRGVGREVLRRMGLEDAVRAAHTGETGLDFVDDRGRRIGSFAAGTGATAELEILRGQLAEILYRHSAAAAEYRFGDQISALHEDDSGVDVQFQHGPAGRFDAVVIAEGLRSRTRSLVMPDARVHELGLYIAYLTVPRTAGDTDRWRVLTADGGRAVSLRPDNVGSTRATLSFLADEPELRREEVIGLLRTKFAGLGWETARILAELENGTLYFEALGQARLPAWSSGRVVLLGDTAYCASPVSGMGTTLALTGGYVLAGELARQDDPRVAFARYEQVLRPLVGKAQKLMPGAPGIMHPRSRFALALLRGAVRVVGSPLLAPLVDRLGAIAGPPADAIELPGH
ncbi:FAD-binding monooxygenase [Pseudonocardiaceae bacterium YIM PH 21723]|nr:FAD-binding monooxygenase [Pseudonocardiaceae bacterium YIM PH 21723]